MIGGIVEVAQDGRYLRSERGFLVALEDGAELTRLPKDAVEALILSANQTTVSKRLLVDLANQGSITLLTGSNFSPAAMVVPIASGVATTGHPEDQFAASRALKKRLWQSIVVQKIRHQAKVVAPLCATTGKHLFALSKRVKSGDAENLEAQAARRYFPALFGDAFRRNRETPGINAALNYGYAVLRSACARGLYATGLHPAIGIHHQSRRNPLCLADDLIEPFRPLVDSKVVDLLRDQTELDPLSPEVKKHLVSVLQQDMLLDDKLSPLSVAVSKSAVSLAKCLRDGKAELTLPEVIDQPALI